MRIAINEVFDVYSEEFMQVAMIWNLPNLPGQ